jgi:hypothetical protein
MIASLLVRSPGVLVLGLLASLAAGCAAQPDAGHGALRAQRGGTQSCHVDADCRLRLPRPRPCPQGGQSVPTACCRMNYCGICWSECGAGGRSTDADDSASPLTL